MANTLSLSADPMMKHWLLNLAIECPAWLGHLFPTVAGEALNVMPIPGRIATDYARGLIELFDSRMIGLSSDVPGDDVESGPGVAQVLDRFLKLSNDDPRLRRDGRLQPVYERNRVPGMQVSFKLTNHGGEAWEKVAEPDWGRFVSATTYSAVQPQSEMAGDLVSADRDLLIAYMGWYPEVNGEQIQLDTIKWQTHTDFEILYWKRLLFVYHASFQVRPAEPRWNGHREPHWFRDWWTSTCSWHKKPWQLPSWPPE
jgi:hypothetical protein